MDLQDVGRGGMDWFAVAWYRERWCVLVHWVSEPSCCVKCGEPLD
jgi:hypothetical protein